jgi:hypothetical protein
VVPNANQPRPTPAKLTLLAVLLMGAFAASLVIAQMDTLSGLSQRADMLRTITDPIKRDEQCVKLCAKGRQLDKSLAPDARIFISDMLGKTNVSNLACYYFFRNYLFPRDVEISLGTNLFDTGSGFIGTPCDSPDVLRTNGFDLLISYSHSRLIVLTPKGAPK